MILIKSEKCMDKSTVTGDMKRACHFLDAHPDGITS